MDGGCFNAEGGDGGVDNLTCRPLCRLEKAGHRSPGGTILVCHVLPRVAKNTELRGMLFPGGLWRGGPTGAPCDMEPKVLPSPSAVRT